MKATPRMAAVAFGIGLIVAMNAPATAQSGIPSPRDFAMASAQSDAYEIDAARVAEVEAQDPRIRKFAKQMIQDHTMTRDALKAATLKSNLPPPPDSPNSDQARMLYALQSLKGRDLDREYVVQQTLVHQAALTEQEQYARIGTDPHLKQAANSALPVIRHHLDIVRQLKSSVQK